MAGTTTHYVYGADGLLYGEYDNAGDLIREYVYLNGEPLAQVDAGSPEVLTYLHTDNLGTPRFGTNSGGSQVWSWASDAFGIGAPTGSVTVNLRMPGQYFDAESGLFYNWNRYYNPEIGRYISSDPIGLEGGINTFLYAGANPVLYADPEGLNPLALTTLYCRINPQACVTAGAAVTGAVIHGTQQINQWCQQQFNNESAGEKERRCEENLERDLQTCSEVAKREGSAYYKVCEQQAMLRYSNCLAGRDKNIDAPLPPWRL